MNKKIVFKIAFLLLFSFSAFLFYTLFKFFNIPAAAFKFDEGIGIR